MAALPFLGVGEDTKSRTQAYASVLIIDVKSCSGLKNKALMGTSSPHVRITVAGATPEMCMTQEVKSSLDPEFNESMVFLLVPGMDTFLIQVMCPSKFSGYDEMCSKAVKCQTVFDQKVFDLDLDPQGKISLGFQLLPLAETMFMPAALQAKSAQFMMSTKKSAALEKALKAQTEELERAQAELKKAGVEMEKRAEESEAALAAAEKEAGELEAEMGAAKERAEFLETQTASAKAQAAMDGAADSVAQYVENSRKLVTDCVASAGEALSSIKAGLMGAIGKDKEINKDDDKKGKDSKSEPAAEKEADKK